MKKNIIYATLTITSFYARAMELNNSPLIQIQGSPALQKTSSLLKQINESLIEVEKVIRHPNTKPMRMAQAERAQALEQLYRIQETSRKLSIIMNDTDGWVTQESEK